MKRPKEGFRKSPRENGHSKFDDPDSNGAAYGRPPLTYRIVSPVLALFSEGGSQISLTIPKGATVTFDEKAFNGNKLIEVVWDGKVVLMFTQDLRSRGRVLQNYVAGCAT